MNPPCIVCGADTEGANGDIYEATAFMTHGHYGSTAFDPMNGVYLELIVCDKCLRRLASEQKVLMGQDKKLVMAEVEGLGVEAVIGHMPVKRELVTWTPGLEHENPDVLHLDPEEVGSDLFPEIVYHIDVSKKQGDN